MLALLELARAHAPLIIIAAPLLGAALCFATPSARATWAVGCVAALVSAVFGVDMIARVAAGAVQPHADEGAPLRLDGVALFAAPLLSVSSVLVFISAAARARTEWGPRAAPFAMALLCAALGGWQAALFANDVAVLILAVETAWLAMAGLIALSARTDRGALSGALRMLMAGGVGAASALLGAGFLHRSIGALDFAALIGAEIATPALASVGVGLIIMAFALKALIAPLHLWSGAAFGRAGGLAALAMGAIGAIGAMAALARIALAALSAPAIADGVAAALAALGALSVVIGSVQAIGARSIKRLVAYATAAQAGCVLMSLALGSPAGVAASLLQMFAQTAAALALLGGAATLGGASSLTALDGLARRAPLASAAMSIGALSLMGAPLTIGFLGRWRLLEAGLGAGWAWTAAAAIFASLAAVFFGGRLIERLYFRRATTTVHQSRDPWRAALAPALIAAIAAIAWGLEPSWLLRSAETASHLGAAP